MCLKTANASGFVVNEPVECYKMLVEWKDKPGLWSPTYSKRYEIGEAYEEAECLMSRSHDGAYTLYHDGFHSCKTLEGVKTYMNEMIMNADEYSLQMIGRLVIVRCSICVGAWCVAGEDDSYHVPGYVSSEIKVEEIVEKMEVLCA